MFDIAARTLEEIMRLAPWYGQEGTSRFVFDEAVGALVVGSWRIDYVITVNIHYSVKVVDHGDFASAS